jgi:tetratricopeptide (TPR) repeat protein
MPEAFGGENAESYYDEGLTAAVKGDLQRAAQYFEKAIRLDSTMATAYHQLGKCYVRLGEFKRAIKYLSQVVDKRPDLVAAQLDLGHALNGIGQYEPARRQFLGVLDREPANWKAMLGLAETEAMLGHWSDALKFAQSAQMTGGNNFPVLFMIGEAAKHANQPEVSVRALQRADELLKKYVETNPDKPEGYFLRGEVAIMSENLAGALQHFRDAEQHAEAGRGYLAYSESFTLADILGRQVDCLESLGRSKHTDELRERIAELKPDHPAARPSGEG